MTQFDLPITLTFHNTKDAHNFIEALEQSREHVIWEQRSTQEQLILVTILSIESLEERLEEEDE